MKYFNALVVLPSTLSPAIAAYLSSTPTNPPSRTHPNDSPARVTTAAPQLHRGLIKRDGSSSSDDSGSDDPSSATASSLASSSSAPPTGHYVCGYDPTGGWVTCPDHHLHCRATIFPDAHAYLYCSTPGAVVATVTTTAIANADDKKCPDDAYCCTGSESAVATNYYIASGYTVTGFLCAETPATVTYNPAYHVLNPPQFSASLAEATQSSSSASSTASGGSSSDASGMSSSTEIGIGVGVGVGLAILLIAGVVFFCWRRRQKQKERVAPAGLAQQSHYAPSSTGYAGPMSYDESQNQYSFKHGAAEPSAWSPGQTNMSTYYEPSSYMEPQATEMGAGREAHELDSYEAKPQELPGATHYESKPQKMNDEAK